MRKGWFENNKRQRCLPRWKPWPRPLECVGRHSSRWIFPTTLQYWRTSRRVRKPHVPRSTLQNTGGNCWFSSLLGVENFWRTTAPETTTTTMTNNADEVAKAKQVDKTSQKGGRTRRGGRSRSRDHDHCRWKGHLGCSSGVGARVRKHRKKGWFQLSLHLFIECEGFGVHH